MKRRDFLLGTAGAFGSSVPFLAGASVRPCAPSPVSVKGGTQVNPNCSSLTPEQDWLVRSTSEGVVWAHDFRSYSEVSQFSDSAPITSDSGVRLKNGRNQDPDRADPNTYETPSGYHNTFLLLPGEKPKSGWPNTLPGVGSGALIVEQPDAIAWNGYPEGTYFRWSNATKNVQVVFPNGTVLPGPGQVYSNHSFHRFNTGSGWMRPLAPLTGATNGRGVDDPAANGRMPRYPYPTGGNISTWEQWVANPRGFWAHPSEDPGNGSVLGNEFWLQLRVWVDPNEYTVRRPVGPYTVEPGSPANKVAPQAMWNSPHNPYPGKLIESPEAGKLLMLTRNTELTGEWVHGAGASTATHLTPMERVSYKTYLHQHYTMTGSAYPPIHYPYGGTGTTHYQTNPAHSGGYHATCNSAKDIRQPNACWEVPAGEWWTLMLRFRPGRTNVPYQPAANLDTLVEIKVARWGETEWTHILYDDGRPWFWSTSGSHPRGMSTLRLVNYRNEVPFWVRLAQAYTQVIFSTQEIPCPRVY